MGKKFPFLGLQRCRADTACIFIWLEGGPSHLETYDLKPEAPAEYRGLFRPIRSKVPGLEVCELLPRHAAVANRFTLIRSCHHSFGGHEDGSQLVFTGRPPTRRSNPIADYPDLGSICKRAGPPPRSGLPSYVALPGRSPWGGAAYLGRQCEPFLIPDNPNRPDFQVPNLWLTATAQARLQDRLQLLGQLDQEHRDLDTSGRLDTLDSYRQEAVRMLTSPTVRDAFAIDRIEPRDRDRYGRTRFGQTLSLARRLVEAGVHFVGVITGADYRDQYSAFQDIGGAPNWDDHAVNWHLFESMKRRLPVFDQALAALIQDLYERGLDRRVLAVVTGEFGRTPRITYANGRPGRDHYPQAMSILVSGGGMRMGQVIGATDAKGSAPKTRPLSPEDLLATIFHFLGINPKQEFRDFTGRPLAILAEGEPIRELLA
jgi:hypothetical protein